MTLIYDLYGLKIKSGISLPCPQTKAQKHADIEFVTVSKNAIPSFPKSSRSKWFHYQKFPDGSQQLSWKKVGDFLILPNQHTVKWYSSVKNSSEYFRNYFLNQILSFNLIASGIEPLHGTSVAVNGAAVLFLGDCGYGKSTLAGWFVSKGYPLITDDLVVFKEIGKKIMLYPGMPRLKLFPNSSKQVFGKTKGPQMVPGTSKFILPMNASQFLRNPLPLKAIYTLPHPDKTKKVKKVSLRPLTGRELFLELIANTFNSIILDKPRIQQEFFFCHNLVSKNIPARALLYPRKLSELDRIGNSILDDLRTL